MEVKCVITDYSDNTYNYNAVEVSSVFADGDNVKISFKDTSITVSAEELISAIRKCKLDYKGL